MRLFSILYFHFSITCNRHALPLSAGSKVVNITFSLISLLYQVNEGFDPAELGDTIRQLALSVHDTGMFGDLPRPRMMGPRGR